MFKDGEPSSNSMPTTGDNVPAAATTIKYFSNVFVSHYNAAENFDSAK